MPGSTYSSPKIAQAFRRHFGNKVQTIQVEMKYIREVGSFIRKVEAAHRVTANSKLVFK
jgi:hypothetical protein